ncbi:MAG: hypothetical protein HY819_21025 [Acidobacteria bacterium]|nr:hypothetical protein [Acidobacteriota bacterium]
MIEYEQNEEDRAVYGEQLLKKLSDDLSKRGRKGFSVTNLKYFREFALAYPLPQIGQTLSDLFGNLLETVPLEDNKLQEIPHGSNIKALQFPSIEKRQLKKTSLPWQNEKYYQQLFSTLSWSHLLELCRVDEPLN